MKQIQIKLHIKEQKRITHITIGYWLPIIEIIGSCEKIVIICDQKLTTTLPDPLKNHLLIPIPSGEVAKSREVKAHIEDELLRMNAGLGTHILAIGGGASLDVAGYAASTFGRGLPLTLVPTTLLAMVDASIGGKNGINLHGVKNCVGTIYHPAQVIIDISFLDSLSHLDMCCGLAEMMKHALLSGSDAVQKLKQRHQEIMHKEKETLLEVIHESVSFKCKNVEHSITHPVVRDLLNFGHTIAHAIEYGEGPSYPHGMAVAQGIIAECSIAHERGVLSKQAFDDICVAMQPLRLPRFSMKKYQDDLLEKALMADKKTKNGTPHIVLLQDIGKPLCLHDRYAHPVTLQECRRALEKLEACNL